MCLCRAVPPSSQAAESTEPQWTRGGETFTKQKFRNLDIDLGARRLGSAGPLAVTYAPPFGELDRGRGVVVRAIGIAEWHLYGSGVVA